MNLFWVGWRPRCNTKGWNQNRALIENFKRRQILCPETGDGIEVQHKISEQYYACKVLHKARSTPVQTNVHIEFDEF